MSHRAPAVSVLLLAPAVDATLDLPDAVRQMGGLTQITVYWEAGAHPTKFHAEYDKARQAYRFTFSAFTPAT